MCFQNIVFSLLRPPNLFSRPITSYGALDLPTYFLDLTPWVPLLTDGQSHNFTIDVVSAEENHAINANWYVSGLLQVVTDDSSKPTTGKVISYSAQPFSQSSVTSQPHKDGEIDVTVSMSRKVYIESTIVSGSGKTTVATWSQDTQYSNHYTLTNNGTSKASTIKIKVCGLCDSQDILDPSPSCVRNHGIHPKWRSACRRWILVPNCHQLYVAQSQRNAM